MKSKRIVSFLPSATELIYELEAQEKLFGVTHECNYPNDASSKPRVIESVFEPENMSSQEIDDQICSLSERGEDIYKLVTQNVINAKPDLIISQEICEVCSAYTNQVKNAIKILDEKPEIYSMSPHDVQGILKCVKDIAEKIDKVQRGIEIVNSLNSRINKIKNVQISNKPKVLGIEWIKPFFTSGHWVPEMIEFSGGINMITKTGEHSRKMNIEEIENTDPDVLILMPCGFDVQRTVSEYNKYLRNDTRWNQLRAVKNKKVFAVDANSFFSKPSIRIVKGIEILAKILHPEIFTDLEVPNSSFLKI
ncbi:MAG: cobalamin-binding protein [Thaumarchaeota archaeon]|nr:cobalamin-binding protein [Nitrososphaerota archaeon]MBT3743501.1 cobalamin-binding protein [Nitrososphaerota archaeon]MBT4676171.1 cobalamin-binding protein [Nitrososphaerota archaeon]MBT6370069.1 cobalamin-binding protein [Nitrososphaerota archaeon]MBT7359786.1 cobalamin-binding protein [Nitrososphaerota archaeon]